MSRDSGDDDPLGGDPFENDPLADPFGDDGEGDEELAETFSEIDRSTLLAFVVVAAFVHAGLFAVALGLLLLGFRGQWLLGGGLAIAGLLALALAWLSYRRYRTEE